MITIAKILVKSIVSLDGASLASFNSKLSFESMLICQMPTNESNLWKWNENR